MQPVSGLLHHRDHESERQYGPYGQIPPWNTGRSSFQRFQETPHEMSNRQVAIQNKANISEQILNFLLRPDNMDLLDKSNHGAK